MPQLELELLRSFVAVVDTGGFTRAGEQLSRTQSTISLHIKRLEKLLGHRLLERTPHRVRLTDKGEILFNYSRRLLQLHDEACTRLLTPRAMGIVRLGVPDGYAADQLPRILRRFKKSHPYIQIEVRSALSFDLHTAMAKGDLDLTLARRTPDSDEGEGIWREPLVWVDSKDHPSYRSDPLPLVLFPHGCVFRPHVLEQLEGFGRAWKIAYTSTSLAGVQAAVRTGMGIAVIARSTVLPEFVTLGVKEGFPRLPDTEVALYRSKSKSAPVEIFANFLKSSLMDNVSANAALRPASAASAA